MNDIHTLYSSNEERLNFIKGLVRIARSDNKISPEEEVFFINASQGLALEESQINKLKEAIVDTSILLPVTFPKKEQSIFLLKEAIQLCFIDGRYSDLEKVEVTKLAKELNVSPIAVVELEEWVQEGIAWTQRGDNLLTQLSGE
jgi:uncharacterized tellurite resistance protein B-like protein